MKLKKLWVFFEHHSDQKKKNQHIIFTYKIYITKLMLIVPGNANNLFLLHIYYKQPPITKLSNKHRT